jgi:hypothetical protein
MLRLQQPYIEGSLCNAVEQPVEADPASPSAASKATFVTPQHPPVDSPAKVAWAQDDDKKEASTDNIPVKSSSRCTPCCYVTLGILGVLLLLGIALLASLLSAQTDPIQTPAVLTLGANSDTAFYSPEDRRLTFFVYVPGGCTYPCSVGFNIRVGMGNPSIKIRLGNEPTPLLDTTLRVGRVTVFNIQEELGMFDGACSRDDIANATCRIVVAMEDSKSPISGALRVNSSDVLPPSATSTRVPSISASVSVTPSLSMSRSISNSKTPSLTTSFSSTMSTSFSNTMTRTMSMSPSMSVTPSFTSTLTSTASITATATVTLTMTPSLANAAMSGGIVTTYAGSGAFNMIDDTGANSAFRAPTGITVDPQGNVFVADTSNNKIRKITPDRNVTSFAGFGGSGFVDDTGTNAQFFLLTDVTADLYGNLFVADRSNQAIRKVTSAGVVTTLAGSLPGDFADATGTNAKFRQPSGIAVDAFGYVYVADTVNNRIRVVDPGGTVSTLAGTSTGGWTDATGTNAKFNGPVSVALDLNRNVFVADRDNSVIRKVTQAGVVTTLAGSGVDGFADGSGTNAQFWQPCGVAVDSPGNVIVADRVNNRIRKVTPGGMVTTVAGQTTSGTTDGVGTNAMFGQPTGVAVDVYGTIYVADKFNNKIRKIV